MIVRAALRRWGGILVRPRRTLEALAPGEGKADGVALAALFVVGSQLQNLAHAAAQFTVLGSYLNLFGSFARSLLTPLMVALLVESLMGVKRARYRNLPLVPLVLISTLGNLARQQGLALPGPSFMPELVGTAWAAGLAVWIRRAMPASEPPAKSEPEKSDPDKP